MRTAREIHLEHSLKLFVDYAFGLLVRLDESFSITDEALDRELAGLAEWELELNGAPKVEDDSILDADEVG